MLHRAAVEAARRQAHPPSMTATAAALQALLLRPHRRGHRSWSSSSSSASASAPAAAPAPAAPSSLEPNLLGGKLLVANRGEIACRIMRTARRLGIPTVAVYSSADRDAPHVRQADEAVCLGPAPSSSSYLDPRRVLDAARATGAAAVHPGYGFLSESHEFAAAAQQAGLLFVGPPPSAIRDLGDKIESKRIALAAGLPTIPGWVGEIGGDPSRALAVAEEIGWPVIVKASRGGGGKGMRVARSRAELEEAVAVSRREAEAAFGDGSLLIEKYVERARHVEVQVIADSHGACVYFPERDCSIQRRQQKIIEESPSPWVQGGGQGSGGPPPNLAMRRAMGEAAVRLARAVGYASAGTVEFVVDASKGGSGSSGSSSSNNSGSGSNTESSNSGSSSPFYFLEMNTRLQVEHPITEAIAGGIDLVELMLRVGAGERLPHWLTQERAARVHGAAMEARLYAEDPARGFLPSPGTLIAYREPRPASSSSSDWVSPPAFSSSPAVDPADPSTPPRTYVRLDRGVSEGGEVPVAYDAMLGKLVVAAPTREAARRALASALDAFVVRGVATNLAAVRRMLDLPAFVSGDYDTGLIAREFGVGGMPTAAIAAGASSSSSSSSSASSAAAAAADPLSALDPLAFPLPDRAEREVVAAAVLLRAEAKRRLGNHGAPGNKREEEEELTVHVAGGSTALPRRSLRVLVRPAPAAHVGKELAAAGRALEVQLPDAVVHVHAADDDGQDQSDDDYSPYLRRLVVDGRPVVMQLAERPASAASALGGGGGGGGGGSHGGGDPGLGPGVLSRRGAVLLQHRGAQREVLVEPPRVSELSRHMPTDEERARRRAKERGAAVRSPMTGTVAALRVKPGDRVAEGDEVAVVSAMKMMMPLLAPRAGVVKSVGEGVAEGQGVAADAVIVALFEEGEEGEEGWEAGDGAAR